MVFKPTAKGNLPWEGNTCQYTENTKIRTIPIQKAGMEIPRKAPAIETRSKIECCFTADIIPIGMAMTKAITRAPMANSTVAGKCSLTSLATGFLTKEFPNRLKRPAKVVQLHMMVHQGNSSRPHRGETLPASPSSSPPIPGKGA